MNTNTSPSRPSHDGPPRQRALVLGGGGSAGNAWLIGVVAGLADAGLDATVADLIIGTSAGATAAAQITGARPARLFDDILSSIVGPRSPGTGQGARRRPASSVAHMERTQRIIDGSRDPADMRRRMGAAAIELAAATEGASQRWHDIVAGRLPRPGWPDQRILLTAVDAATGESVIFDRDSGVDLVDAVAASCASGFAYRIGDHDYIDGGYRTNAENADLADGYAEVLVLAPFGGASRTPADWGTHLSVQLDALKSNGSSVETLFPDRESRSAFGDDVMAPSTRLPAAQAGFRQGKEAAASLARFWR